MAERGFIGGSGAANGFATASSTVHFPLMGRPGVGTTGGNATEAFTQFKNRGAADFKNLHVVVTTNARTTPSTALLRVNGADTALSVTIPASTTGTFADTTNSVAVADGDLVNGALTTGSGSGTLTISAVGLEKSSAGQCSTRIGSFMSGAGSAFSTASSTVYYGCGTANGTTTESRTQARAMEGCTLSNFQVYVDANARTTSCTIGTRKNGANGGQSVTVTAGSTGLFEDTTGSDTLAAGDLFNFRITSGAGTETLTWRMMTARYVSANPNCSLLVSSAQAVALAAGATTYFAASGYGQGAGATEATHQAVMPFPGTIAKAGVYVSANASTADTTWVMRKNGADTAVTVTVTALTTGSFVDTTHSFAVARGDLVNWKASGAATGTVTLGSLTALLTADAVLTATGLDIGSPVLGSPAVTQVHSVAATGLAVGSPAFGTPALTQVHSLAATGLDVGALAIGSPILTQVHGLTAVNLALGSPEFGSPVLSVVHVLTATAIALGSPEFGTPALTQTPPVPMAQLRGRVRRADLTGVSNRDLQA